MNENSKLIGRAKSFNQETTQLFAFHEKLETFYFGQLVFYKFYSK